MKKIIIAFTAMLLFISCENSSSSKEAITEVNKVVGDQKEVNLNETEKGEGNGNRNDTTFAPQQDRQKQTQQTPSSKIDWDKKIIRNANLNLEVKDFTAYNTSLRQKIKQFGGYVAQEEQSQSDYKIENMVTIKVPVDQFDDAVNSITSDVKELKEKKVTSQDVTTEVIDTRSRIETKKQVRVRYLDLLKQAKNMEEILNVQSEINGIQEQIESAAGRIEYLNHASSFSTINLTFYQVLNATAIDNDKPSFATRFGNAFRSGWEWVGELSIGIVSIWPLLILVSGVVILYKKANRPKMKQE